MSVYSARTGLSSILKAYTPMNRDKTKSDLIRKVCFDINKLDSIVDVVNRYNEESCNTGLSDFVEYLQEAHRASDAEFIKIVCDANTIVYKLTDNSFSRLVETLLELSFVHRSPEAKRIYADFCVDMLVAQTKYMHTFVNSIVRVWIPEDNEAEQWPRGIPNNQKRSELEETHTLLGRILTVIPVSFNVLLESVERAFPYFKKPSHVLSGYIYNLLWLLEYNPMFTECILNMILQHLVLLDVNASRDEIEDSESNDGSDEDDDLNDDFKDDLNDNKIVKEDPLIQTDECEDDEMKHPIAHSLDICLEQVYNFLDTRNPYQPNINIAEKQRAVQFSNALFKSFERDILAKYNTHHVQFIMFYYCSFKHTLAESFLSLLWNKVRNLNVPSVIRQAAVGYMASFLARANYVPLTTFQNYLKELCDWAHNYIQNCDQYRTNVSLKANLVFYTICQAVFYMIAFRSRNLTANKKGLLFLQSLHLPGLVTSHLNPLRVCLPAVATAFAGVTRNHQLAYCHAVLERNARRKLATIYGHDYETPEETLDTFFPFDPYLLKLSNKRIKPLYLQYQASDSEGYPKHEANSDAPVAHMRKRGISEMIEEGEIDDFLIAEKRQRVVSERGSQFTYDLAPGFHI